MSIEKVTEEILKKIENEINSKIGSASIVDVFTPSFMHKHTKENSIFDFFSAAGLKIESQQDFNTLDISMLDKYVKESTKFKSWDEMKQIAGTEYAKKKLNLA